MANELENRIEELKKRISGSREVMNGMNELILINGYIPSEAQQRSLELIAKSGREMLAEIEQLEEILKGL